jgi:alpha-tubulin suppressor-like RCC1 family protein
MNNSLSSFIFIVAALHCSLFWGTGVNGEGQCYDKPGVVPEAQSSDWTCPYVADHLDLCGNKFVAMHCPTTCESYCPTCRDSNKRLCKFIQTLSQERLREYCETSYQANTGCPETCDSCLDGCQDNPDRFIFNIFMDTHKTSCEEGKPEWCKDEKGVFAQNCKITCGLCIVVPPMVGSARSVFIGPQGQSTFVTYDNSDGPKGAGRNDYGQLGINSQTIGEASPIDISLLPNGNIFAGSTFHTCAVENNGELFCMGRNYKGQLGIGSSNVGNYPSPQQVTSLSGVTSICSGWAHTCAIAAQNVLWCWGSNDWGENGNGSSGGSNTSPVQVDISAFPGVTPASVSCGYNHACALFNDNKVRCWGRNSSGQIGADPGTTSYSAVPVEVNFPAGSATPQVLSCGHSHNCVSMSDNTISCWGYNNNGALGTGTMGGNFYIPQPTTIINNAVSIYAGGYHSCALLSDKSLYCWGSNYFGQLGLGNNNNLATPTLVPLTSLDVKDVATGNFHTCAVLVNGSVWCWGKNSNGHLGLGYTYPDSVNSPVETLF